MNNYYDFESSIINYETNKLHFIYDKNGEIYFRPRDACIILGYSDIRQVIKHIDKNYKLWYKWIPNNQTTKT